MKNLDLLNQHRITDPDALAWSGGWIGDHTCGAFYFRSPIDRQGIRVIASTGGGWDHVSVSRRNRCPNWQEMEFVAQLFFEPHEHAFQLHVPPDEHINVHPYCLHWWRPHPPVTIPLPPVHFVGIKGTLKDNRDYADRMARKLAGEP